MILISGYLISFICSSFFYANMPSLFSSGEYILADSGYASLKHIVPTFKRSHLSPLTSAQNHFNNALAKLRVALDHCNSMLKGRFGSLKELRLVILDEESAAYVCAWIAACVVIQNFLIVLRLAEDLGFDDLHLEIEEDLLSESAERSADMDSGRAQWRASLFEVFVLEKGYST